MGRETGKSLVVGTLPGKRDGIYGKIPCIPQRFQYDG